MTSAWARTGFRRRNAWLAVLLLGPWALLGACSRPAAEPTAPPTPTAVRSSARAPATFSTSPPDQFTLVAAGDVLLHERLWQQAKLDADIKPGGPALDFAPMLAPIKPLIAGADLAICHLETPLAAATGPFTGYPAFSGPPSIAPALASTGFDACSTASNHSFDQGAAGIDRSLAALDREGIAHHGTARTPAEAARSTIISVKGIKVGLLSFSYGFNGFDYPQGDRWRGNIIDLASITEKATEARAAGAEVVVLSMHWGTEYSPSPSAQQRELMPKLAALSTIDLVLSHHAHVVEPVQKIGAKWVTYGLGNMLAWHSTPGDANAEGLVVRFTFSRTGSRFIASKAEYAPIMVAKDAPIQVLPVQSALASGEVGSSSTERLTAALNRTRKVVENLDGPADGLTPIAD